ncbi:MAG: SagB/ThcOx family dehydrogenase [Nitrospirota bacterium]
MVKLPEPRYDDAVSVEQALRVRRSIREYANDPLTLAEISQLLWAAQGITDPRGLRASPSAGALYPLEIYIAIGRATNLPRGIYKYRPQGHEIIKVKDGDRRDALYAAALRQSCVKNAAAVIVFSAVYERTERKYGERGSRYVHMEVGHAAQNIYLQAVSLHLGTVFVGAFEDNEVKKVMGMPYEEQPLGIMPLGRIR